MLGILFELAVSWVLLWMILKENILALGIFPVAQRLKQFIIGFLITAFLCVGTQILEALLKSTEWVVNENMTSSMILSFFYWDLKSVVTEELLFRGALLYILIKKLGASKGILISAIAFGIFHWFSLGIIGNIIPMTVVFIGAGLMGYAWALAFARTKSIAMPIGFHLGWNFTFNSIFSNGPLGNGLLILENDIMIGSWFTLIGMWLVPLLVLLYVKFFAPEVNLNATVTKSGLHTGFSNTFYPNKK